MTRDQIRANARTVVSQVSPAEYAQLIGLTVNRNGFCNCPFHSGDRTGSMKVYQKPGGGWHCFGCHEHGDIIELAKRVFGLTYPAAIEKVAQDMGVSLPFTDDTKRNDKESKRIIAEMRERDEQRKREQRLREIVENKYWEAFDKWLAADRKVQELAAREKQTPDKPFSDEFCGALNARQIAKEELDYLIIWRDKVC